MGINYYDFVLWLCLSPAGLVLLLNWTLLFFFCYWRLIQATYVRKRFDKASDYDTTREYIAYHMSDHGPVPVRVKDYADLWFKLLVFSGLVLAVLIGVPVSCSFTPLGQTWLCS